jgi:hypothetical protein
MADSSDISNQSVSSRQPKENRSFTFSSRILSYVIVLIVLCVLSFLGGMAYEKGSVKSTPTMTTTGSGTERNGGFGGNFGGRHDGGFGTVSAVSASSITIENSRTGTSTTYTITASTQITDNGQTISPSAITSGETVVVTTASSTSTTATAILVNPSFGGGAASGSASTSGSASASGSSDSE